MSEIKDINKLVIKNSATIELQRRKGFVNILLQGNPNLYRAWVEKNNKIVIDISGESTEYNLDTQTPDYIEILKDQDNNKYYINFIGSLGTESFVSDDMTFTQEGDSTRISIKKSKFISTDRISSGSSDYLYVTVDESGNVSIGLTQEAINKIDSASTGGQNSLIIVEINSELRFYDGVSETRITDLEEIKLRLKNSVLHYLNNSSSTRSNTVYYLPCFYTYTSMDNPICLTIISYDFYGIRETTIELDFSGSTVTYSSSESVYLNKYVYLTLQLNSTNSKGYISYNPSASNPYGFKVGDYGGQDISISEAIGLFKQGCLLKLIVDDIGLDYASEYVIKPDVINFDTEDNFAIAFDFNFDGGYPLLDDTNSLNTVGGMDYFKHTKMYVTMYAFTNLMTNTTKKQTDWYLYGDNQLFFETESANGHYKLNFVNDAFSVSSSVSTLFDIINNLGKLYYKLGGVFYPCELCLGNNQLFINVIHTSGIISRAILWDSTNHEFYTTVDFTPVT